MDLGKPYDARNFVDLALLLLALAKLGPLKTWTLRTCLGSCTELQVICSGMIAKAFEQVGYPILPERRHYSQVLPRDFDLSPNFEVIKARMGTTEARNLTERVREYPQSFARS